MSDDEGPLYKLAGTRTEDGWEIVSLVQRKEYQTGGCFSVGYLARHDDGREGFLKALDFTGAANHPDPARALQHLTATFNFERDVLALCAHLSKVVLSVSNGALNIPDAPLGRILYLVFELAEGDVRKFARRPNEFETIWSLRALHHVAVGIGQLHKTGIFHQDIKPSNVLVFKSGTLSKLADLGRAYAAGLPAPHDFLDLPGAPQYAPPEQFYGFDWGDRTSGRAAADLYLLGSLLFFFFVGIMFTPAWLSKLRPEHSPRLASPTDEGWAGKYVDVLPFLSDAFASARNDFAVRVMALFAPLNLRAEGEELVALLGYLTDPDPRKRGHPGTRADKHSEPLDLARFISALDRIGKRSEWAFRKANGETAAQG
jgi:serine/threonine protein kinase